MASSRTLDRLRSRLLRGALAFVLLSAGSLLTPATAASAAATTSAASNYLRVWTPENITPLSLTQDQAVAIAQNFGVVVAGPNAFASYVSAMKAANPSVVLLAYENATFTPVSTLAEGMYAHSSTTIAPSTRILNGGKYPTTYLMNPSNASWVANREATCRSLAQVSGYDGCSLDALGSAPLDPGYTTALPINPVTGQIWTPAEWYAATSSLATAVKTYVAPLVVYGNGLRAGTYYFDPTAPSSQLFQGTVDAAAEAFVRGGPTPIDTYKSETDWKQDVDMLVDAGQRGHGVLVLTKCWTVGTQAQKDAWHEYALATFLLGTDGNSQFFFSYADGTDATAMHPWWKTVIGTPAGRYPSYQKVGGVYERTFTGGVAIVNPTTSTASVNIGNGRRRDVNTGAVLSGTVTVPSHTGLVLVDGVPGAPTIGQATAGDSQATVGWAPPSDDGGSPITGYTVTASPGGNSATVPASATSATVTGLADGTTYTLSVHATNAIGDGAESPQSNPVTPQANSTTPTSTQDSSSAVTYGTWTGVNDSSASGGSYRTTNTAGQTTQLRFSGPSVSWITRKGPDQGQATVTIDGVNQGTVDLYAPSTQAQAGVSFGGLASATHTIVVKALGTKNASSSGTAVAVDGFAVGTTTTQETANAFTFSSWAGAASASASGGTYRSSAAANATVSFTFTGSAVDWVTATGAYGQATVTIDGIAQGTFDLSSPTAAWQVKKSFSGLGPGPHTIVIKVLGTKSPSSTSAKVVVDAFVVHT